ncbi:MAG: multicopper oxidase domain-containing protein [Vicinamibacterales bacterium]
MVVHMRRLAALALAVPAVWAVHLVEAAGTRVPVPARERVVANDNRRPAGERTADGVHRVTLRAAVGRWQPEGPGGPSLEIEALGEAGQPLSVPGPLIRVPMDTPVAVTMANELDLPLVVHGLCTRAGDTCPTVTEPPHATEEVRFSSGAPGTYHYWASTIGAPVPFRELAGALVVDEEGLVEPDRILVITEWSNLTATQLRTIVTSEVPTETFLGFHPRFTFVINGLSWPGTERFAYDRGARVRWRILNLSSQTHPMHLHGFYFDVDSLGDGLRDRAFDDAHRRRVVTQVLPSGATMSMTWVPERAGNWLFHCHVMDHVSPDRRIEPADPHAHHATGAHDGGDPLRAMAGMVVGITVRDPAVAPAPTEAPAAPRRLTLEMRRAPGGNAEVPAAGFVLREGDTMSHDAEPSAPGPPIVLRRGEPVEILLANQMSEATAIHWHGMELESVYDGVHGWSGAGEHVTPMIAPGGRFVVRFTPPRAGTFIYHTHVHDYRQLSSGLYGALIVLEPGETFDPTVDHVVVLGRSGLATAAPSVLSDPASVVINGSRDARLVWAPGRRHRIRIVNITPDDVFGVLLQLPGSAAAWTPVAKDGAPVPPVFRVPGPATQVIAVGETYDFAFDAPPTPSSGWLEVRTPSGRWQAQARVLIR